MKIWDWFFKRIGLSLDPIERGYFIYHEGEGKMYEILSFPGTELECSEWLYHYLSEAERCAVCGKPFMPSEIVGKIRLVDKEFVGHNEFFNEIARNKEGLVHANDICYYGSSEIGYFDEEGKLCTFFGGLTPVEAIIENSLSLICKETVGGD